jgi:DNA-binding PadR family transcriptional regulator
VRELLHGSDDPDDTKAMRRRSGQVTRKLRLLRAHGLIRKVSKTHRYLLTAKGKHTITFLLTARDASVDQLAVAA